MRERKKGGRKKIYVLNTEGLKVVTLKLTVISNVCSLHVTVVAIICTVLVTQCASMSLSQKNVKWCVALSMWHAAFLRCIFTGRGKDTLVLRSTFSKQFMWKMKNSHEKELCHIVLIMCTGWFKESYTSLGPDLQTVRPWCKNIPSLEAMVNQCEDWETAVWMEGKHTCHFVSVKPGWAVWCFGRAIAAVKAFSETHWVLGLRW